jgi:adenylate cyclase
VEAVTRAGMLTRLENIYYDLWHQLAGKRYEPTRVVIVSLDDESLQADPELPLVCWTTHFATVMEVLSRLGAKVIGLDYHFMVSIEPFLKRLGLPPGHPGLTYNRSFKEQLASGKVVMAGLMEIDEKAKRRSMVWPIKEYLAALPRPNENVGLLNFVPEGDGVIRRYVPAQADDKGQTLFTFAQLLMSRARGQDPGAEIRRLKQNPALKDWSVNTIPPSRRESYPIIGFVGPPGSPDSPDGSPTFKRIPFQRFLSPQAEKDAEIQNLKDKIVIIAHEPSASQDMHITPYAQGFWGWEAAYMSGPELHANIIETLLTGKFPRPVPGYLCFFYLVAVLLGGTLLFYRVSSWGGLAAALLICAGSGIVAYLLFRRYWLLPVANVQLGIILSYMGVLALRLTGEERERAHLRKVFGRYVADEVVEELLASGQLPDLGGKALQVTVLFSDIRNFTAMAESLAPHQVVEMLNTYFSQACESILDEGGTVDKFMGDAVMAVFGSPVPYPDHARRALRAALNLAARALEFRVWMAERFAHQDLPEFRIGIGLHTGEAIVGNIGSPKRLEFTAIGDVVNAASRLEGLTKDMDCTIVASRDTILGAGPGVVTGRRERRAVKGRKEPLEVFEIIGLDGESAPDAGKNPDHGGNYAS